jgi:hypothetical protein
MLKCFRKFIERTVEAYVDDIVVKSKHTNQLVADLRLAFEKLRENNIKLNPEKCVFGVPRGMLLGFIISKRGIEANPEKIAAITKMVPIQNLMGYNESLVASRHLVVSSHVSMNEDFPFIVF